MQASIGAVVMLATVVINRVMVVEYGVAAAIPAGLVAWHYAVQLARPLWGFGSDRARARAPWVWGGMVVLALGAWIAAYGTTLMAADRMVGIALGVAGFAMIGAGVGCAGTSLLAILAARVAPERRAPAAAICWMLMIFGIAMAAVVTGKLLDPFSPERLLTVVAGVGALSVLLPVAALWGVERGGVAPPAEPGRASFREAVRAMLADPAARRFTGFVFLSMLAYSVQDLIVEPFAGLVFGMTPGQSTSLAGAQHGATFVGMVVAGLGGWVLARRGWNRPELWLVAGCGGAALALIALAQARPGWPLAANVMALGFSNGIFTVAAIGAMVGLGSDGGPRQAGVRMGVFGAAQAVAFGLGGLLGAAGVDALRGVAADTASAFHWVFLGEAALFLGAAVLSLRVVGRPTARLPMALAAPAGAGA